jgi:hypothetical protein
MTSNHRRTPSGQPPPHRHDDPDLPTEHQDGSTALHCSICGEAIDGCTPEGRDRFGNERPCTCECNDDPPRFCGGCGHAGCGGRRRAGR